MQRSLSEAPVLLSIGCVRTCPSNAGVAARVVVLSARRGTRAVPHAGSSGPCQPLRVGGTAALAACVGTPVMLMLFLSVGFWVWVWAPACSFVEPALFVAPRTRLLWLFTRVGTAAPSVGVTAAQHMCW